MPEQQSASLTHKEPSAVPAEPQQTTLTNDRAHPLLRLQRTIGNQAVQQMLHTQKRSGNTGHDFSAIPSSTARVLQKKLTINTPGDEHEQEADHVAEQVMRMPEPQLQRVCACGGGCSQCQGEQASQQHERLQMKSVGSSDMGQAEAPSIVHDVLRSPGQPLDPATRGFMETRIGHDFSGVRVHADGTAEQSAREVNARAYTVGQDIVFGAGQFVPGTQEGQRLLAHELTHVVQQSDSRSAIQPMVQRSPNDEKSCAINQTILVDQDKPGQERCITEDDPLFQKNYIDNNIVQAIGLAIPDTTWENIDHDRIPQMKLTYKDGRTLIIDVKDIPLQLSSGPALGSRAAHALRPLARYERRSDGLIYPIRSAGKTGYVSYGDANNIMSLRAGLHDTIEELKQLFVLIQLGVGFGADIAALSGIAALAHSTISNGSLFEPIPKKQNSATHQASEEEINPSISKQQAPEKVGGGKQQKPVPEKGSGGSRKASVKAAKSPEVEPEPATGVKPWRGKVSIQDGDHNGGWIHIDGRHVSGNHPDGAGDLFAPGTTRVQLEKAANEIVQSGFRVTQNPLRRMQTFQKVVQINGKTEMVRVYVDTFEAKVITIFPPRSE